LPQQPSIPIAKLRQGALFKQFFASKRRQNKAFVFMTDVYSVEGVTAYIRELFDSDPPLQDIWVKGEVSNMKPASSGHWYFTLKDEKAQLRCVMFRHNAERQSIQPRDGEAIQIHGKISLYEQRGEYQLYADELQPAGGIGDLYLRFEQLKAKLQSEGLFDEEVKRPIPPFAVRIGVVTSPDAAAFRDIQHVLARRFPIGELILSPTLVQGFEAPPMIVQAIQRLNRYKACDVILICRGGGSIEDLWAFNDERVAREIAKSEIPTISGIGHETDFTIADFVADLRAPTPSAAAEIATPNVENLREDVEIQLDTIRRHFWDNFDEQQNNLDVLSRSLGMMSPERYIRQMRQVLDERSDRLQGQERRYLALLRERLANTLKALNTANPEALLERGYAIVKRSDDGKTVTAEKDAPVGTGLTIRLKEGEIKARVEDKESHANYKRTLF
jgi:exodeoxyribonuclease VII large subunit